MTYTVRSKEWKAIVKKRMEIDNYQCVMCGSRGSTSNVLECHHLSYKFLGREEERIYQDLCILCHSCHKQVHNLMCRKTAPNRNGWKDRYDVPKVSVYTVSGEQTECKEVGRV